MLKAHNLIYFAQGPWDTLWRNRQQLMSIFARQNRVLYVEGRPTLRTTLHRLVHGEVKPSDLRYPFTRKLAENLFVFRYPAWAPDSDRLGLERTSKRVGQ